MYQASRKQGLVIAEFVKLPFTILLGSLPEDLAKRPSSQAQPAQRKPQRKV